MYIEGMAKINDKNAFLNSYSQLSRDISIAILDKEMKNKKIKLLDSTAATGIRGIRYFKELGIHDITFLDINELAYKSIISNIKLNGINKDEVKVVNESIQMFVNTVNERFDVVDLDPFGTPVPNLYDIMKVVKDGGLLMVSATDTAVLCGAHMKACLKNYGAVPLHDNLCHESGLRILIGYVCRIAAKFNFGIDVEFSLVHRHFMRIVVRFHKGADKAYTSLKNLGFVGHCTRCGNIYYNKGFIPIKMQCGECSLPLSHGGIMWLERLYGDNIREWVYDYFKNRGFEFLNVIELIKNEIENPFYFHLPSLTKIMHTPSISPGNIVDKLINLEFNASLTHIHKESIKTDADLKTVKNCILSVFNGNSVD